MSTFVIILETRPTHGFATFHIEYCKELLQTHPEYLFFQDMLESNLRYSMTFLLQKLLTDGWTVVGQSQGGGSLFYTLKISYKDTPKK